MTKVKICGIKSLSEAVTACSLGAWAVGEVFASSPRQIEVEEAAAINHQLNTGVLKIGVFVNEKIDSVKYIARTCLLDAVQLHGDEPPDYVEEMGLPVIKSFRGNGPVDPDHVMRWHSWAYLFDTYSPDLRGGSGKTFNWEWLEKVKGWPNIILAGGLNSINVALAIKKVRPMAVDVSSGVEFSEGGKDPAKIKDFLKAVKETDKNSTRKKSWVEV